MAVADSNSFDWDHVYAHVVSAGAIGATMAGYLPEIAAAIGAFWYLLQAWETKTVQSWAIVKSARWFWWTFVRRQPMPEKP